MSVLMRLVPGDSWHAICIPGCVYLSYILHILDFFKFDICQIGLVQGR